MKKNLNPVRSKEEAREKGRKGGIASGEVRREKKKMKEQIEMILSLPTKNTEAKEFIKSLGVKANEIDNQMVIVVEMISKAMKGDTKAFELIRDIIGESPNNEQKPSKEGSLIEKYRAMGDEELQEIVEKYEKINNEAYAEAIKEMATEDLKLLLKREEDKEE